MRTNTGGTVKYKVPQDGKLYFCYGCGAYLKKHWYVHQCSPFEYMMCYSCLEHKTKVCKRCGCKYTAILKNDSVPDLQSGNLP